MQQDIKPRVGGTMNRLGWKTTAHIAGILILGSGVVAQEEIGDSTHEASSEIPYKPQILKYGLEKSNTLKRVLPDLHSEVISPDWIEMGGSDKLRLVVGSMTNVWGANDEDIDDFLSRIDHYESYVTEETKEAKEDVGKVFGLIGEHLLIQFFLIERHKETIQSLVDAFTIIWEDNDPDKLVEYERCVDQTIVAMGANTRRTFGDWLDGVEMTMPAKDMFVPLAILYSKASLELANWVTTDYAENLNKCNPDPADS